MGGGCGVCGCGVCGGGITEFYSHLGIDPAVCKHVEIAASTCQGYLVKLGGGWYLFSLLYSCPFVRQFTFLFCPIVQAMPFYH